MDVKSKDWGLFSWVKRGRQRLTIIKALKKDREITGQELRKEINESSNKKLSLSEVSRHLTSFKKRGLVKCLDENQPYSKHYILTELGVDVKDSVLPKT